jgi:tetratricopeptide (TPR) repeat protein
MKLLLLAALAAAAPRAAYAEQLLRPEQVPDKARRLAEQGRVFHDAGDYARAIAAYKEAYVLAPSPGLLFNLAQAYRLAGDCDDAAWMYRRYLDTNPTTERRAIAESHLAMVDRCRHDSLHVAITPVSVGTALPQPPTSATRPALAIDHGRFDSPWPEREQHIGLAMIVSGGVLLAGAGWYAYDAYDASNAISDVYRHGGKGTNIAQLQERGESSTSSAEWLGLTGAAAAVAGIAVYLHGRHAEHLQHVAVSPVPHGATIGMTWRY